MASVRGTTVHNKAGTGHGVWRLDGRVLGVLVFAFQWFAAPPAIPRPGTVSAVTGPFYRPGLLRQDHAAQVMTCNLNLLSGVGPR